MFHVSCFNFSGSVCIKTNLFPYNKSPEISATISSTLVAVVTEHFMIHLASITDDAL